jgi:hypothetical protein
MIGREITVQESEGQGCIWLQIGAIGPVRLAERAPVPFKVLKRVDVKMIHGGARFPVGDYYMTLECFKGSLNPQKARKRNDCEQRTRGRVQVHTD